MPWKGGCGTWSNVGKKGRTRSNVERKGHLVKVLGYLAWNWKAMQHDEGVMLLRAIAVSLYLRPAGIRLLHEGHEIVENFEILWVLWGFLTMWEMMQSERSRVAYASRRSVWKSAPASVLPAPRFPEAWCNVVPERNVMQTNPAKVAQDSLYYEDLANTSLIMNDSMDPAWVNVEESLASGAAAKNDDVATEFFGDVKMNSVLDNPGQVVS